MLYFADTHALDKCDLSKGDKFIEPLCHADGKPMSEASSRVIARARDDSLLTRIHGTASSWQNPYKGGFEFGLYGAAARAAWEGDANPYA
jgi:hypothetical protein